MYSITPTTDVVINIDLYGSQYDTLVYVYRSPYYLVACNDDYYTDFGYFTSYIGELSLTAGETYYIVVDGHYQSGVYDIAVEEFVPCEILTGGIPEGEPPLQSNYIDQYNGGCNSQDYGTPFQELIGDDGGNLDFCGESGWYSYNNMLWRDTDWFIVGFGAEGVIEVTIQAEEDSRLLELWPRDCDELAIRQTADCMHCEEATMSINGAPNSEAWLWVGPAGWSTVYLPFTYSYSLRLTGLEPGSIAVEHATWGQVKALYR